MLTSDTLLSSRDDWPGRSVHTIAQGISERTPARFVAAPSQVLAGERFDLHRHEEDQLAWMASGAVEIAVGGDRWHLRRDHAVWIPAGDLHEMRFAEAGELLSIYVDPADRPAGDQWACARVLRLDGLGGALLRHLMEEDVPASRRQACFSLLRDLVAEAPVSREVVALPRDERARAIGAALLADPTDRRDLSEWATAAGVSTKTIARAFVADTGSSFREWRVRARLHVAVGLLLTGEPVHTVAPAVGYDSVSSFIVAFRARFGVTPAAYAARSRERVD